MQVSTTRMTLQVWYGVLFAEKGSETADRPRLASWAEQLLDEDGRDGSSIRSAMAERGYTEPDLTWIEYAREHDSPVYYGLAIAESVQSSQGCTGEVAIPFPEDLADEWAARLAGALAILMEPDTATAKTAWYQTVRP